MQRRLAAVLSADVFGYSRLMGVDEIGTLRSLKSHRRELVDPEITKHHGRIVKTTGDGMLVEFASVVDAVACAVNIQREMLARNAAVPEERQIVFRIGINVGDIIIDGDDIFGDGVNIAARLEALCEPGGVCISRAANEQIRASFRWPSPTLGSKPSRILLTRSAYMASQPGISGHLNSSLLQKYRSFPQIMMFPSTSRKSTFAKPRTVCNWPTLRRARVLPSSRPATG